jgi:TatA/E family protein of Tat protein translocase
MNILAFGIGNLGGPDLFIILLIVLVLFGAKNLPDLARSIGQSMNEFRKLERILTGISTIAELNLLNRNSALARNR